MNNDKAWELLVDNVSAIRRDINELRDDNKTILEKINDLRERSNSKDNTISDRIYSHESSINSINEWRENVNKKINRRLTVISIIVVALSPIIATIISVLMR